jgi:hypothetical protein
MSTIRRMISRRQAAEKDAISVRTQMRREKDPALGFPVAIDINGRVFFWEDEHDAWREARPRKTSTREVA